MMIIANPKTKKISPSRQYSMIPIQMVNATATQKTTGGLAQSKLTTAKTHIACAA